MNSVMADLGSEYIGNQLHIWNDGRIAQDYYYSGDCNQQLSNQRFESWEDVIYGMTYGDTKEDLLNNYIQLHNGDCNMLNTSTSNSVNFTAWKDVSFLGKTGRLAKNSYLEVNDNYMKETFMFRSNSEINQDIWFVIKRTNIDISANENDNFIKYYEQGNKIPLIYNLSKDTTIYKNQDEIESGFFIEDLDTGESITYYANPSTNYYYAIKDGDIYLMYNAGTFTNGQIKKLTTLWVDAKDDTCLPGHHPDTIFVEVSSNNVPVGDTYDMNLTLRTTGICIYKQDMEYHDDSEGGYLEIPGDDTDQECIGGGAICFQRAPVYDQEYSRVIRCEGAGTYNVRGYYSSNLGTFFGTPRTVDCEAPPGATVNMSLIIPFNESNVDFQECILKKPTEITTYVGVLDAGNINSLFEFEDSDSYNVSETTGTPAFTLAFNFTDIISFNELRVRDFYDGNLGHVIDVCFFNYTSDEWNMIYRETDEADWDWHNITNYNMLDYLENGKVQVQFNHTSPGNINHDLYIDYTDLNSCPIEFIFDINASEIISNCSLIRDGEIQFTINSSIVNGTNNSIWWDSGAVGTHNWTINCTLDDGSSHVAEDGVYWYNVVGDKFIPIERKQVFPFVLLLTIIFIAISDRRKGEEEIEK